MSKNHVTPRLTPQPFCAVYAPLLPLLHSDELEAVEQASVNAHLADCTWCQKQLATFDIVDAALRRHYGLAPDESAPPVPFDDGSRMRLLPDLILEDVRKADQQQASLTTAQQLPCPNGSSRARITKIAALGALAAVLMLAFLAASLFVYLGLRGPVPAFTPNPASTATVQAQAYRGLLEMYYVPVQNDHTQQLNHCMSTFDQLSTAQQVARLPTCQAILAKEVADVQTLLAQLATAQPPPQWQSAHTAFTQAVQALATYDAQRLQAIDARSVSQFVAESLQAPSVMEKFCTPIARFNSGLSSLSALAVPDPSSC